MYKILIVDDEPAIRQGLTNFINWEEFDCTVVGQGANGAEAIELIKSRAPDIVITDIKMPGINGIELARYVFENAPKIKVIILTGFADFSFAQTALRYGVIDFILKPTAKDKVLEAIAKAKQTIEEGRKRARALSSLQTELQAVQPDLQTSFLEALICVGPADAAKLDSQKEDLKVALPSYYVVAFQATQATADEDEPPAKYRHFVEAMCNIIKMTYTEHEHYILTMENKTLCCVLDPGFAEEALCCQYLLNSCEEILQVVNTFTDYELCAGISARHIQICELSSAYREARQALDYKFYSESYISMFADFTGKSPALEYNEMVMEKISQSIRGNQLPLAKDLLRQIFEQYKNLYLPIAQLKSVCIQICFLCSQLLAFENTTLAEVAADGANLYQHILTCENLAQLLETMYAVMEQVIAFLHAGQLQSNTIVTKAREYIQKNYSKPIALPSIAASIGINSSYLSRLFHKETGATITDAIVRVRMEKAKELLKDSTRKAYDIAWMVGIEDSAYFSQLFKKYAGMSPKEYRYQCMDNNNGFEL